MFFKGRSRNLELYFIPNNFNYSSFCQSLKTPFVFNKRLYIPPTTRTGANTKLCMTQIISSFSLLQINLPESSPFPALRLISSPYRARMKPVQYCEISPAFYNEGQPISAWQTILPRKSSATGSFSRRMQKTFLSRPSN